METKNIVPKIIFFFLLFCALSIIISCFSGMFWLNSFFVFVVSLIVTVVLFKKFYVDFTIPKEVYLLFILLFCLCVYPVLTLTPFFPASADAVTTTSMRLLEFNEKIPSTYTPYSNVAFTYQLGYPLLAKLFNDLVPVIPDYLWPWLLGCVFAALQLIAVYLFSREFFKSDKIASWAAIIFFGTKLVFENTYNGSYSWVAATTFILFFLYFFMKENKSFVVFFPVVFILHPAAALNMCVFFLLYFFFFKPKKELIALLFVSLVLAVPSFIVTYSVILQNLFSSSGTGTSFSSFFTTVIAFPPWIGIVPFMLLCILLLFKLIKHEQFTKQQIFVMVLFIISLFFFVFLAFIGNVIHGRVIELVLLATLFTSASFISELRFKLIPEHILKLAVLLLCIFFFMASSILIHYRSGSKVSMDETEFALMFNEYDPLLKETLFLSGGSGKIAEFSNKIPYDTNTAHTVSIAASIIVRDDGWREFEEKSRIKRNIIESGCTQCIYEIGVEYVVINRDLFDYTLAEQPVLSYKQFDLYKLN